MAEVLSSVSFRKGLPAEYQRTWKMWWFRLGANGATIENGGISRKHRAQPPPCRAGQPPLWPTPNPTWFGVAHNAGHDATDVPPTPDQIPFGALEDINLRLLCRANKLRRPDELVFGWARLVLGRWVKKVSWKVFRCTMACLGGTRRSTCADKEILGNVYCNKKCPTRIIVQYFSIAPCSVWAMHSAT